MKKVYRMAAVLGILGLLLASQLGRAFACDEDTIDSVSGDGAIITMLSGHVYQVDGADQVDTSVWLSTEDVVICFDGANRYKIVNKEENGETAEAELLK